MGVWADFEVLSGVYSVVLDKFFEQFIASKKSIWCRKEGAFFGVEVSFYDCSTDVLKLIDNDLCNVLPGVRLVYGSESGLFANISMVFSYDVYGFELVVNFSKSAYFRFLVEKEEGSPESFHIKWSLAGVRSKFVYGDVVFDNDPSEEEAVKAVLESIKKEAAQEGVLISNVDEVVEAAVKIVGALAKYMSRRIALFDLFP